MIQNEVLAAMQAKRQQLEAQRLELEAKLKALEDESKATDHGTSIAQEALATLEQLILDTPEEVKPALFKSLFKALEQEAKRSGIKLVAEVVVSEQNGNGKAPQSGKRTRKTMDDISEPSEFAIFPTNKRLGIDGVIKDDFIRYSKVYIGVTGLKATPASPASAKTWKDWLDKNDYSSDIKTGALFPKAMQAGLDGIYLLELNDVILADLSRLVDLDFSQSPESEHNERLMNKDYRELKLLSEVEQPTDDDPTEQPEESKQPGVGQVEEIRETEPVEVQPVAPNDYYHIGTKFQLVGVDKYDGTYGEIIDFNPNKPKPYECDLRPTFPQLLMLAHEQIQVIPEDDTVDMDENLLEDEQTEDEEDLNIPF